MNHFLGNFEAKVDAKGRVFVPAAFRKLLQLQGEEWLVLRKDIFQDCLVIYPGSVWEDEIGVLRSKLSKWNKEEQQVFRQFLLDAERLEMDGSGRILISKRYLELVGIDAEVRFLGVDKTIEVWAKSKLDKPLMAPNNFANEIQKMME